MLYLGKAPSTIERMTQQFFIRIDGQIVGPVDAKKLKAAFAAGGFAKPASASKSQDGPWTPAVKVPGIIFAEDRTPTATTVDRQQLANGPAADDEYERADDSDPIYEQHSVSEGVKDEDDAYAFLSPVDSVETSDSDSQLPVNDQRSPATPSVADSTHPEQERSPLADRLQKERSGQEPFRLKDWFDFQKFYMPDVARSLMRVTYALTFLGALFWIATLAGQAASGTVGPYETSLLIALIVFGFLLSVVVTRLTYELVVIPFRIYELLRERL